MSVANDNDIFSENFKIKIEVLVDANKNDLTISCLLCTPRHRRAVRSLRTEAHTCSTIIVQPWPIWRARRLLKGRGWVGKVSEVFRLQTTTSFRLLFSSWPWYWFVWMNCSQKVSTAFEFGGTPENPRTRDNWFFRAISSDVDVTKGLIIKVKRRPRTRRGEDPHPTLRIMQANPNGMLYVHAWLFSKIPVLTL